MKTLKNFKQFNESKDSDLKNPDKADLNKDGKLSEYEKKRGKAIEDAIEKDKKDKGDEKGDDVELTDAQKKKIINFFHKFFS